MAEAELKLRIKYCGGCNPEIDRVAVVGRLEEIMRSCGVTLCIVGEDNPDVLLLVNGCPRACLEQDYPEILDAPCCFSIQGERLEYRPVSEEELPAVLWEKIRHSCPKPVER
jgi:hypothetical protein